MKGSQSELKIKLKGPKRQQLILERKKLGLTQGQLAKELNVSTAMVSHVESGRANPGINLAMKFQQFYNQPLEILFPY